HAAELGPTPGPGAAAVAAGHDDHARPRRGGDGGLRPGLRRPPLLAVRAAGRRLRSGLAARPAARRAAPAPTLHGASAPERSDTHDDVPDNGAHGMGDQPRGLDRAADADGA